jgi:hypothetical protein
MFAVNAPGGGDVRGRSDRFRAERASDLKSSFDLRVREIVTETQIVSVEVYTGPVELAVNGFEMIERSIQAPTPEFLARLRSHGVLLHGQTKDWGTYYCQHNDRGFHSSQLYILD